MMDLCMIAVLVICLITMKLFADWCQAQIGPKKK